MATSRELETAIQKCRDLVAKQAATPQEMRANFAEATSKFNQVGKDIKCEPVDAGGVTAEWIAAPNAVEDRVLMFLHGGPNAGTLECPGGLTQGQINCI